MFLSKISIHSCIIKLNNIEKKIFAVTVYKPLVQKKYYWNFVLKTGSKLMVNRRLPFLKKVNALNSKIMKEK